MAPRSRPAGAVSCACGLLGIDGGLRGHERDQVADMHHADRIVERVVSGHQARMSGVLEHLDQFTERNFLLHGDDVAARQQASSIRRPRSARMLLDHGALFRRDAGFARTGRFQHHFDVGAGLGRSSSRTARGRGARRIDRVRRPSPGHRNGKVAAPPGPGGWPGASELDIMRFRLTRRDRGWRGRQGSCAPAAPSFAPRAHSRGHSRADAGIHGPRGGPGGGRNGLSCALASRATVS